MFETWSQLFLHHSASDVAIYTSSECLQYVKYLNMSTFNISEFKKSEMDKYGTSPMCSDTIKSSKMGQFPDWPLVSLLGPGQNFISLKQQHIGLLNIWTFFLYKPFSKNQFPLSSFLFLTQSWSICFLLNLNCFQV